MPPCSLYGNVLTIRKFNPKQFGIEDLLGRGSLTEAVATRLKAAVIGRQNMLISGGTGIRQDHSAQCLSNLIPKQERVLMIEDTAEIQIEVPNLVRL